MLVKFNGRISIFPFSGKKLACYDYSGWAKKTPIKTPIRKREFKTSETFTSYFSDYLHFCRVLQPNSKYF